MTLGTETTKRCSVCGEVKPLREFYTDYGCRGGHKPYCKTCPRPKPPTSLRDLYDRSTLDPESGCIVWGGILTETGYGTGSLGRRSNPAAHRVAWELAHKQPIPKGWHIHHTCGNRACVNVAHLDMLEAGAHTRLHRTSGDPNICKRGHNDWIVGPRGRQCRECRRLWGRERSDKRPPSDGLGRIQRAALSAMAQHGGGANRAQIQRVAGTEHLPVLYQALRRLEERGLISRERRPRPQPTVYRLRGEVRAMARKSGERPGVEIPARTAAMVAMRGEGATLRKIGDAFGVSNQRVRQILVAYEEKNGSKLTASCRLCGSTMEPRNGRTCCPDCLSCRDCGSPISPDTARNSGRCRDCWRKAKRWVGASTYIVTEPGIYQAHCKATGQTRSTYMVQIPSSRSETGKAKGIVLKTLAEARAVRASYGLPVGSDARKLTKQQARQQARQARIQAEAPGGA